MIKINLSKFHTRQLLNIMRAHHRNNVQLGVNDRESLYEVRTIDPEFFGSPVDGVAYEPVTIAQLKAELATREHVPNKKEAKMIRQDKALRGRR